MAFQRFEMGGEEFKVSFTPAVCRRVRRELGVDLVKAARRPATIADAILGKDGASPDHAASVLYLAIEGQLGEKGWSVEMFANHVAKARAWEAAMVAMVDAARADLGVGRRR
jgi:hypothetical protein